MQKTELMAMIGLDSRDFEAFGGNIIIRNLTIKEMLEVSELEGADAMFKMVSYAMVKPKMTVKDLEGMSGMFMNDLTNIVNAVTPSESK